VFWVTDAPHVTATQSLKRSGFDIHQQGNVYVATLGRCDAATVQLAVASASAISSGGDVV
jgi:hypothetical protein